MKEEPIRVQIRGARKTYFPPMVHPPADDSPPDKRLTLNWVYPFTNIQLIITVQ
jgi:microtubule-associated protein-like 1/2